MQLSSQLHLNGHSIHALSFDPRTCHILLALIERFKHPSTDTALSIQRGDQELNLSLNKADTEFFNYSSYLNKIPFSIYNLLISQSDFDFLIIKFLHLEFEHKHFLTLTGMENCVLPNSNGESLYSGLNHQIIHMPSRHKYQLGLANTLIQHAEDDFRLSQLLPELAEQSAVPVITLP